MVAKTTLYIETWVNDFPLCNLLLIIESWLQSISKPSQLRWNKGAAYIIRESVVMARRGNEAAP